MLLIFRVLWNRRFVSITPPGARLRGDNFGLRDPNVTKKFNNAGRLMSTFKNIKM